MKSTDAPSLITTPFAQNGTRNDIPASDPGFSGDDAGRAAFATGFPDITMRPITAGGKPPFGADFNGVLYALSNAARFYGAGGHYQFNGSFAAAIGGYPMGATVQASDNMGHWLNVVESNTTNPESALSTGWLPLADHNGTATVTVSGNTTLSALQAAKANIRFAGSPSGNSTITFPAWTKRYSIINDCTGDQSLICTTGNGESISIKNGAKYEIGCDGKNLTVATVNATQVFAEPNKNVSSLDAPTVQQIINALGSASKHNENDFERQGVAADLDDKLWKLITANYVAKAGGTYDGVINGQSPARGDRGSAITTAWWCGQEFDVKGAADAVQRNLDKVNDEAWKGINSVWDKSSDAQKRVGFQEYLLSGTDDRRYVYLGDPTGQGVLWKLESGFASLIYDQQVLMKVTPERHLDNVTIEWNQVRNPPVLGQASGTGLVRMNGEQSIADAAGKDYAASQYQARQGYDRAGEALAAIDAMRPDVIENKSLIHASANREYLYLGSSDKNKGWYFANEIGYVNIYYNGERLFQLAIDKKIHDATIAVEQITGRAEWGDNWFLDKQSGKLWQWGYVSSDKWRDGFVTFPRAFKDTSYVVTSMDIGPGGGWHNSKDKHTWGVTIQKNGGNSDIYGQWMAVGNI